MKCPGLVSECLNLYNFVKVGHAIGDGQLVLVLALPNLYNQILSCMESCCHTGGTLPDQNVDLSSFISHCLCWVYIFTYFCGSLFICLYICVFGVMVG